LRQEHFCASFAFVLEGAPQGELEEPRAGAENLSSAEWLKTSWLWYPILAAQRRVAKTKKLPEPTARAVIMIDQNFFRYSSNATF